MHSCVGRLKSSWPCAGVKGVSNKGRDHWAAAEAGRPSWEGAGITFPELGIQAGLGQGKTEGETSQAPSARSLILSKNRVLITSSFALQTNFYPTGKVF